MKSMARCSAVIPGAKKNNNWPDEAVDFIDDGSQQGLLEILAWKPSDLFWKPTGSWKVHAFVLEALQIV